MTPLLKPFVAGMVERVEMSMPAQISLPCPVAPRLPQLLGNLLHTDLEYTLNIAEQLRVVAVTRHVSSQLPASPPSTVPKERDIARGVSTSRPIDTRLFAQMARKV